MFAIICRPYLPPAPAIGGFTLLKRVRRWAQMSASSAARAPYVNKVDARLVLACPYYGLGMSVHDEV